MKSFYMLLVLIQLAAGISFAGVSVEDTLSKEAVLKPGDRFEGRILLYNSSAKPERVKVYQTDYFFLADGSNYYDKPGTVAKSNGPWVTVSPQEVTVPAGERLSVCFSVQVPADDKLVGTYWSMVMVEPMPDADLDPVKPESGKVKVSLQTIMRYGVQIVTSIGDTGRREIRIADKRLLSVDGKYALQLDLENTGERWVRPSIRADIYDSSGAFVARFDGEKVRIYPGCSVRRSVLLSDLPPGKYTALVILDAGEESAWGAQYELEIK
ncbi:MAG: hypothetical protein ACYC4F_00180 [Armatimonadota bacterium]